MEKWGRVIVCLSWVALFAIGKLQAQEEFSIDRLDIRKGLLSNFVTKTITDDKGFKYFATEAGISRYDGNNFKNYRPQPGSDGLVNENIETLFPSRTGSIWIGTKTGGLSRLDPKTQTIDNWNEVFQPYSSKPLRIVSLTEDKAGNIWVGTWNMGCFKINVTTKKVVERIPSNSPIYSMICDAFGTVWFTEAKTLCAYKNQEGALQRYPQTFYVYCIAEDTARKRIWMAGNLETKAQLGYLEQLNPVFKAIPIDIEARFVASLAIDQKMRVWMGSWGNGLFVSDPLVSSFQKVNTSGFTDAIRSTNRNAITNIYIDKNGIAWLSTSYGGVLILYPNKGFRNIANNQPADMRDYNVLTMGSAPGNHLLAGSISMGLYDVGNPLQPAFNKNPWLPSVRINQVYTKNGLYFIASNEGLYQFSNGLQSAPQRYFPGEKITSVLLASNNELWAGSQQHGLLKMKFSGVPDTASKISFNEFAKPARQIENDRINKIVQDTKGNIWVATHSGINLWDAASQQFISHRQLFANKLPGIIVQDLLVTEKYIYLATPNGLYKVETQLKGGLPSQLRVAKHYDEEHGVVNQFICALQEDRNGNIWFSTTTGLSKLNTHTDVMHHFGKQDGVQINSFHIASSFQDGDGNLYFGGDNGLVFFNPEAVIATYQKPTLFFTGLNINNKPVEVELQDKKEAILSQAIQYTSDISLGYRDNDFAIQFAANDFLGTENISYAYRLVPLDKDWVNIGKKNEVSFTSLPPGSYTLLVRANRNNQGWSNPAQLKFTVAYPPWLAWYAWVFYLLLATAIFIAVRKMRLRQEKLKLELQRVQFEKEKEQEINEAKINFFTNISHEFRTPLTLIMSPCAELQASHQLPEADHQKISLIQSNAHKLLRLINQLLDFRKSEQGLLSLRTQQVDIRKLLQKLVNDFGPAAANKRISLQFDAPSEATNTLVEIDKTQVEMALTNLLSNALKFTQGGGTVSVSLFMLGNQFQVRVKDTGIGIAAIHLDKIFQRFYQVPNKNDQKGGSGIGLAFAKNIIELHHGTITVTSTPGKGTEFTIDMPVYQTVAGEKSIASFNQTDEEEEVLLSRVSPDTAAPAAQKKETILVVDDDEDIRQYLTGLFKEEYEVLEAADGSAGYKVALEAMPDLILSDVMMPQMNGIDLCQEIKNNIATSHIPVILITARVSEAYELEGLKTGADDYIAKPFNPHIVQARVHNILEGRKKLKASYLKKVRFEPEATGEQAENLDEIFLNKAIELVNNNIQDENLGVEMMVDQLFMSQSTLYRKIKSLTGLSITGFIRAIRIKKAAQLILTSHMKMSDIAYEVGFNDYKYFKKSFQQQFGCLPSEYREKNAANL